MHRFKNGSGDDSAQGGDSRSTYISTELWAELYLGTSRGLTLADIDDLYEVFLLRCQGAEIENELCCYPPALNKFRSRPITDFPIVDISSTATLEIYNAWQIESLSLPRERNAKWPLGMLFQELRMASRVFVAKILAARGQALLTVDPIEREFAKSVGLQALFCR